MDGKCKIRGRTVALVIVALQVCALYCLVDQKVRFLWRLGDRSSVAEEPDFGRFLSLSTASETMAMAGGIALVCSAAVKFFRYKKILVLAVFALNFILVLPLQASGIFLYLESSNVISVNSETEDLFREFFDSRLANLSEELASVQEDNCCCGLAGLEDFLSTGVENTTDFCPSKRNCHHRDGLFPGCRTAIPRKLRIITIVSSSIGFFCSLVALVTTPFIYAYFEKDRREERAEALCKWKNSILREMEKKKRRLLAEQSAPDGEEPMPSSSASSPAHK